jgi:O-antigen/teichoic acid export membrane protein
VTLKLRVRNLIEIRRRTDGLVKNALSLVVSGAGSAMIGIVFWGFAAHLASAATVGRMSAEIAIMLLLSLISQLSFSTNFERFLPVAGDQTKAFIVRAYILCISASLLTSVVYVTLGLGHSFLPASFGWRAFFVVAVIMWTIFALQDSVLVGLRATRWVPVENILYSLAKLGLLPLLLVVTAGQGIFVSWMIPVALMIVLVNWYIFKRRVPQHVALSSLSEALPTTRELIVLAGGEYGGLVINVLTGSLTTLIVINRLGAVANARYYIPAQIALGAFLLLSSILRSFVVEVSSDPSRTRHFSRLTLRTMVALLVPALIIGIVLAPEILGIFGHNYESQGTLLLRMMLLSVPAMAVTQFYFSFALLDKRIWWFALRQGASAVIFFSILLIFLSHFGIRAIGAAYLIETSIQAIFFLPILIKRYRRAVAVSSDGRSA